MCLARCMRKLDLVVMTFGQAQSSNGQLMHTESEVE